MGTETIAFAFFMYGHSNKVTMTGQEAKNKITKILDELSDDTLVEVYKYLQSFEEISSEDKRLAMSLNKILKEDKEVLEKLAQ